jgi:hypothetical protein
MNTITATHSPAVPVRALYTPGMQVPLRRTFERAWPVMPRRMHTGRARAARIRGNQDDEATRLDSMQRHVASTKTSHDVLGALARHLAAARQRLHGPERGGGTASVRADNEPDTLVKASLEK